MERETSHPRDQTQEVSADVTLWGYNTLAHVVQGLLLFLSVATACRPLEKLLLYHPAPCCFSIWCVDDFAKGGNQFLSCRLRNIVLIRFLMLVWFEVLLSLFSWRSLEWFQAAGTKLSLRSQHFFVGRCGRECQVSERETLLRLPAQLCRCEMFA